MRSRPGREHDAPDLRAERGRIEQAVLLRIDPDVRAGPVGHHASSLNADLPRQGRLPRLVAAEVDRAQTWHRRLPPLGAVLRGPSRANLAVLDSNLRRVGDLRKVQVTRDAGTDVARRRVGGLLAAKEEIVPADFLDRLAQ